MITDPKEGTSNISSSCDFKLVNDICKGSFDRVYKNNVTVMFVLIIDLIFMYFGFDALKITSMHKNFRKNYAVKQTYII